MLSQIIGHGLIPIKEDRSAALLAIHNVAGLVRVVYLVNGRMRTPKIGALYLLIDWLNTDARDCEIQKLPLDYSSIGSNGWLAGFTEGDGCFEGRTTAKSAQSPPIREWTRT